MKLFVWKSNAFRDYAPGAIVVMAEDVEMARLKVIEKFGDAYANGYYKKAVTNDVAQEPEVPDDGIVEFVGSA